MLDTGRDGEFMILALTDAQRQTENDSSSAAEHNQLQIS
jgi:hypothetical protein